MSAELSPARICEVFTLHAKNRPNSLKPPELRAALNDLGFQPTDAEFEEILKKADDDGNGTIELDEFFSYLQSTRRVASLEQIVAAFKVFDQDNDGKLTKLEFEKILRNLGEPITQEEIQEVSQAAGMGDDGLIDYEKYVQSIIS
jgi:Ca2+-binding EF-hand superfamily protein